MPRDTQRHGRDENGVNRRDVLKTVAGTATAGALGTFATGTAAATDYEFAFLTDDVDVNWYHHRYHAEYSATDNTTFVVYQSTDTGGSSTSEEDSDGDAYILAYDHDTGDVVGPYRIGYNPIGAGDTHGVGTLVIDGDGYIHVVFGSHGYTGPFQYAKSANPYDISSWVHPPSGSSGSDDLTQLPNGTYPNLTYNPDEDAVYVLYRKGGSTGHNYAVLGRSADGGVTWTDVNSGVMDFSGGPGSHNDAYVSSLGAWAGRIHMTWTIAEDHGGGHNDARRNIYHAAYNPSTGNVENMSGVDLGSTITWSNAVNYCMIKDTGDWDISGRGDSVRGFNHGYDPATDTAYIPAKYAIGSDTSQQSVFSYQGVSTKDGTWQETKLIQKSPAANPTAELHINENGRVETEGKNANGEPGLWIQQSDGTYQHHVVNLPAGVDWVQRGVTNGVSEFSWYAGDKQSDGTKNVYAMGKGQPSGAGADYTRPPKNLRVADEGDGWATVDWDHGRAGPSGVDSYNVYVDGSFHKSVTTTPPSQPYPRTWTDLSLSSGDHTVEVTLVNKDGVESATSNSVTVNGDGGTQSPYGGTPWSIPGRIEAEDYDEGGQHTAYYDTDSGNNGGAYRSDDVDVESTGDSTGSYNVGWVRSGEWLEYTCDIDGGTYDLDLRVATPNDGREMHVEVDGTDVTGPISIPNTGSWQTWTTVTVEGIDLTSGEQVVRLSFDTDSLNVNYHEWILRDSTSSNLLTNPGFEDGTTGWHARHSETISTVSSPVHSGSAAGQASNRSNRWDGPEQTVTSQLSNNGQGTYDCEAYVRLGSGTGNAKLTIHVNDDNGDTYFNVSSTSVDDSSWTKVTASLDVSWSGLNEANFYVETDSTLEDLLVDDASLTFSG